MYEFKRHNLVNVCRDALGCVSTETLCRECQHFTVDTVRLSCRVRILTASIACLMRLLSHWDLAAMIAMCAGIQVLSC